MAEVAKLEINVRARTGRALTALRALNTQINQMQRSTQALNNATNRLSTQGIRTLNTNLNNTRTTMNNLRRPTRGFRDELNQSIRETGRFMQGVQRATGSLLGLGAAFLFFSSFSLAPILLGLVGLLGSLTAVAGVATVALGGFFLAVANSERASKAADRFGESVDNWAASLEDITAPPVEHFLETLADNLTQLNPIIESTSGMLLRGSQALEDFLQTEQFKSWMDDIRESSETILPNLGSAFGDFFVGVMEIIRAFLPMGESFSDWIRDSARRFREWSENLAESDGFQRFSDWIYENAPTIISTLGEVLDAFGNLVWSLRDIGITAFEVFGDVAEYIGDLDSSTILTFAGALLALSAVSSTLGFVSGLAQAFAGIGPALAAIGPQALVIGIIVGIAAAMYIAWQRSEEFRSVVQDRLIPALSDIWDSLQLLLEQLGPVIDLWLDWITVLATAIVYMITFWTTVYSYALSIVSAVIDFWEELVDATSRFWGELPTIAQEAMKLMLGLISLPLTAIYLLFTGTWDELGSFFSGLWDELTRVVSNGVSAMGRTIGGWIRSIVGLWNSFTSLIGRLWSSAWRGVVSWVVSGVRSVISGLTIMATAIGRLFSTAVTWLVSAGKDIVRGLWNGILSMKDWILDKVGGFVGSITDTFTGLLDIFSPSRVFMRYGEYIGQGLGIGMERSLPTVNHSTVAMVDTVTQPFVGAAIPSPMITPSAPMSTTGGSSDYVFDFRGAIITGGQKQVEDMVIQALSEAQRKGRVRGIRNL